MGWNEYKVRTEELITRIYMVNAQSQSHATEIVRSKLEEDKDRDHECVDIFEHGEEVKP